MLKNVEWSTDRDYKTNTENEPVQFYLDALSNSSEFNLLLGYFSTAAINLLSLGFASFIAKGGNIKMVINHLLSENDKSVILKGLDKEETKRVFDLTNIVELQKVLDEYDTHFFECIAYLISQKRINVKVIKPINGRGIAHYKSGVFYDGQDYVGYRASCNFTLYGLSENLEQLDAYLSWENGRSNKLIKKELKIIDDYFLEKDTNVEYLPVEEIEVAIRNTFGAKDLNELLVQEEELIKKKQSLIENRKLKKTINKIFDTINQEIRKPKFPHIEGPRDYQVLAYNKWIANNKKGLFAMATGTGKTITALNCLLSEFEKNKTYKAVIIVPTIGLAEQWEKECHQFNFRNILKINSKVNWQDDMAFLALAKNFIKNDYIIIVTYASFSKKKFQDFFKGLDKDTILIGDEVHNIGAPAIKRLLPSLHLEKRIGLSATPKRVYDEDGGNTINEFFNDKEPYTYSFSMQEAIEKQILCRYLYYPHIVRLSEVEFDEYSKISKQLAKYFDGENGKYKMSDEVEKLLLKRKRIIHKAVNKLEVFQSILTDEFRKRGNLKYTLVYVPEGIEPDYADIDTSIETEDDINLIDQYTKAVSRTDKSIMVKKFTGNTPNRDKLIKDFGNGTIHTLTSMKCLDEGIDVPRSELAIFCSSTGNPRQFIQRRGRVLRRHNDKIYATIHDLVVIPNNINDESTFNMEKGIVQKELERVVSFADLADNKTYTFDVFEEILQYYNLNLNDIKNNL
jgi:superfamily II DNA or RNA helicase